MKLPLDMLHHWEQTSPNKVYLHQPIDGVWYTYTFQQFGEEVRKMAAALHRLGLPPRSNIALISKNCAHWLIADLAILMAGHISIPLYPNCNADTLRYVLEHSEAKAIFIGKLDEWENTKSGLLPDITAISFPKYGPKGYIDWDEFVANAEPIQPFTPQLDDIMTIIYTSGTTGKPKGVVHTFKSMGFAIENALTIIHVPQNGRFFSYLPLSHIAERMLVEMGSLYTGAEVYFAQSLDTFAENLRYAKPTIFLGVPRIWTKFQMGILAKMPEAKLNRLLRIPILNIFIRRKIKAGLGLNAAEYCLTGAAPMPSSLIIWYQKLGIHIQEVYGMTENAAYSHYTRREGIKPGYAGQSMPKVEVKISSIGELLVKSDATMQGYYKAPELTADSFDDGFLRTGDKGEIDKNGFLRITGRVKELFKTEKGKYVSPAPIEMMLSENDAIEQVCVVGANLPQPIALVVLSAAAQKMDQKLISNSLAKTLATVNNGLESHEKLKKIIVLREEWTVENGLLTPTLKIKREPIENKYCDQYEVWYKGSDVVIWE